MCYFHVLQNLVTLNTNSQQSPPGKPLTAIGWCVILYKLFKKIQYGVNVKRVDLAVTYRDFEGFRTSYCLWRQ